MSVGAGMRCGTCNKYLPDRCTCPNKPAPKARVPMTSLRSLEAEYDHDCGYLRGSVICRVCDIRQSEAGLLDPEPAPQVLVAHRITT